MRIHATEIGQPGPEFEFVKKLAQARCVRCLAFQIGRAEFERHIALYRGQLPRQRQLGERGAQVLAGLALDVGGVRDQIIQRAIFREPLDRGLGPDAGHTRDVVRGVADEREVLDDALRRHAEAL